jgi:hypothetical protein
MVFYAQIGKSKSAALTLIWPSDKLCHMIKDLQLAKEELNSDSLAFVIVKDGVILNSGTRDGVGELIETLDGLGESAFHASLADRIVGKAVAMVARRARLSGVYSPLMSQTACDELAADHITFEHDQLVPLILNKRNDGPCPMERLTLPISDPEEAVDALRDFVRARA